MRACVCVYVCVHRREFLFCGLQTEFSDVYVYVPFLYNSRNVAVQGDKLCTDASCRQAPHHNRRACATMWREAIRSAGRKDAGSIS